MRNLYAPWRMEYIEAPARPGCLFCRLWAAPPDDDRRNLVVRREEGAMAVMNRFPYNNGHLMVAPRRHAGSLTGLDDDQTLAVMRLVRRSLEVLQALMSPEGFNVGLNLGRVAGAGIPDHVHVHVVPRWNGDTNFLPVLGEVKVINEHLERTWEKLAAGFARS
ncbi:MAG TPA: HIT domain-containing protein [Candidatus Dormibacteraeota bacterium]|jgi:ATP adenylyltransferase|nr:HIT domain-containing protein [Candidatus Dormibacteraeota bacterium]